jgi:hypothetical protein
MDNLQIYIYIYPDFLTEIRRLNALSHQPNPLIYVNSCVYFLFAGKRDWVLES